ncbi:hypothetical protein MRB53_038188 [Persea americana]|nr:hypothetical protein MRB53_038188 [Persea americana]
MIFATFNATTKQHSTFRKIDRSTCAREPPHDDYYQPLTTINSTRWTFRDLRSCRCPRQNEPRIMEDRNKTFQIVSASGCMSKSRLTSR